MDLRVPSGILFTLLGLILMFMGIVFSGLRPALTDSNVNLYCGISMLVFGGILLLLARKRP
jgi:uncharacterized membrane protein